MKGLYEAIRRGIILKLKLLGVEVIKTGDSPWRVCTLRILIKFRFGARKDIQTG